MYRKPAYDVLLDYLTKPHTYVVLHKSGRYICKGLLFYDSDTKTYYMYNALKGSFFKKEDVKKIVLYDNHDTIIYL